jgi:hypothetical protein
LIVQDGKEIVYHKEHKAHKGRKDFQVLQELKVR